MASKQPQDIEGNVWANSGAKEQLVKDLLSGYVPLEAAKMGPRTVYDLPDRRQLFHQFPYKNFSTNLNNLRKTHLGLHASAEADLKALRQDRILHPKQTIDRRGKPIWDGSDAQLYLRPDIEAGLHNNGFETFYNSRSAYTHFERAVFREHIAQELRYQRLVEMLKIKRANKLKKRSKK